MLNLQERDAVLAALNSLPGDLDGDMAVAFADFLVLSQNFGKANASYAEGNIDLLGGVEFHDFLILSSNFGTTPSQVIGTPEPLSVSLALFGFMAVACAGRNQLNTRVRLPTTAASRALTRPRTGT